MILWRVCLIVLMGCLSGQTLTFENGDVLSGQPLLLDEDTLLWKAESLGEEVALPLAKLKTISYPLHESSAGTMGTELVKIKMARGDSYVGRVASISDETIALETSWAGAITIERKYMNEMKTLVERENLLGDVTSLERWQDVPNRKKWGVLQGGLATRGKAAMAIEMPKINSCKLSCKFQLANAPRLRLLLHANENEVYEPSSYLMISIQRGSLSVFSKMDGSKDVVGQKSSVQALYSSKPHQLEVYCNLEAQKVACFLNGTELGQWVLPEGMTAESWFYLFSDYEGNSAVQNLKVEEWNGIVPRSAGALSEMLTQDDKAMIHLENGDVINADTVSFSENDFLAKTDLGEITLPLARVDLIDFSGLPYRESKREKQDVKVSLQDGSLITMKLQEWEASKLTGFSQNFGLITVSESALQEIEFNIYD